MMTAKRKDELFGEMIAWICEHINNDEDLFITMHNTLGITKEEAQELSIESLDKYYDALDSKTPCNVEVQSFSQSM